MPKFIVKKRVVSVGRDYDVHDESGATVFEIDGKVRFARTFDIRNPAGQVLCAAKEKLMTIDQTFLIERDAASPITVHRTTSGSVNPMKFEITGDGMPPIHAEGSFFRDGINVMRGTTRIANVSREPNTVVAEIFNVWIEEGEDSALMLAMVMAMVEGDRHRGGAVSSPTY